MSKGGKQEKVFTMQQKTDGYNPVRKILWSYNVILICVYIYIVINKISKVEDYHCEGDLTQYLVEYIQWVLFFTKKKTFLLRNCVKTSFKNIIFNVWQICNFLSFFSIVTISWEWKIRTFYRKGDVTSKNWIFVRISRLPSPRKFIRISSTLIFVCCSCCEIKLFVPFVQRYGIILLHYWFSSVLLLIPCVRVCGAHAGMWTCVCLFDSCVCVCVGKCWYVHMRVPVYELARVCGPSALRIRVLVYVWRRVLGDGRT